ncbi:MAG: sulfurtransferase [Balneola sp.]
MKTLSSTILTLLIFTTFTQAQASLFKSTDWLKERLHDDNLVVFNIGPRDIYAEKHIPGAVFIQSSEFTVDSEAESIVYDLPSVEQLTELFQSKGVNKGDTIILYVASNHITTMTRLYYTLNYLGYGHNTFILEGGMPLWEHEGNELTDVIPEIEPGNFSAKANPGLVVEIDKMKEHVQTSSVNIIDARATVFYDGTQDSMGKKGHIPGAKSIPFSSVWNEGPNGSYLLKDAAELRTMFSAQGISEKDQPFIVYCHIGMQATSIFTAAKSIGLNPVLFDGSMHAWGHENGNPVEVD